jgi:peptidoglycan/xylan/chitin deacetylase (PgdA/CDA1 family)
VTIQWDVVEAVLAGAQERGLAFVTYADMAAGARPAGGGLALSFDDVYVTEWLGGRDLFQRYGARITFFVSSWFSLSDDARAGLHTLAGDGHDIEAHSVKHQRGPVYVEERGLAAYMSEEVQPSIDVLRDDGFDVNVFAYPFGARTGETDRAILDRVQILRSVTYTWDSPATDPCPE